MLCKLQMSSVYAVLVFNPEGKLVDSICNVCDGKVKTKMYRNLNKEMVLMEQLEEKADREELKNMLEKHVKYTSSKKAKMILDNFDEYSTKFKKIIPADYKRMVELTYEFKERGMSTKDAQIEAFYVSTNQKM